MTKKFWDYTIEERKNLDPDFRESLFRAAVEEVIANAPPHQVLKLRLLQAKCDNIRDTIKDPLVAAAKMNNLLLELGLLPLNEELNKL